MNTQTRSRVESASALIGRMLLTLDEASSPGEVKDVLVDPRRSTLIGFTVRGHGLMSSPSVGMVPTESVTAIGRDAVMVPAEDALIAKGDAEALRDVDQADVIGREAVSATGVSLGTISDVMLEIEGGRATVVGYEIAGGDGQKQLIAVPEPIAISGDALVLPDDADRRTTSSLASFQDSLERIRS